MTASALAFGGDAGRRVLRRSRVALIAAFVGLGAAAAHSAEPADEFIQGLHERGLYDLALDYLERMETSRLVGDDFRRQIPYHRGVTLIEQSRQTVDPEARSRLLDDARAQLEQFAATSPESVQAAEAQLQLAGVLVEQGKRDVAQADQLPEGAAYHAERDRLRQQARESFEAAGPMFRQAEATYQAELNRVPQTGDSAPDDDQSRQRQEHRGRLAQVRVMAAQAQFETAQTHPPDSPEFRRLNEAAAKELSRLYEEHSRWLVGFYARLYEGRCYQALAEYPLAHGCYEEIMSQSSVLPAFRALIAKAYRHRAECFLAEEKYDAAIESCSAWLRDARPTEERHPDWLAVRFRLAEALQRKAESRPDGSIEQRRLLAEAREAYRLASASPNEFQSAARTAVASLGRGGNERQTEPRSFQQAYDLGKDALASMNAARMALPTASKNNPSAVPELEGQVSQGKDDARHYFQAAMSLVEDDTELASLNEVRYFLCWLYWENRDYYRAAVLGEFLARRYPDHSAAAAAAKLAMAAYEQLYQQQAVGNRRQQGDTEFEARRMAQMAEFITRRWPNTPDADAAFSVLVSYAIRTDRIDDAEQLLARVSDQYRPRLELQLGAAMWGRYLELSQSQAASRPEEATLGQLKERAVAFLRSGLSAARLERQVSESAATAGLYLAQAALNEGQYAEAIRLLEDDKTGPLSLVARQDPAASRPAYVIEVYKAALRAFVSVTPPQGPKAIEVMNALEQTVQNGEQAGDQLTRIYVGLGVALQQQIDELRSAGRDAEAERVGTAFVEFLDRVAARQEGSSWAVRSWIAQTYYNLAAAPRAASSPTPASPPSGATEGYLTKARDAYRHLLEAAAADASFAPSEAAVLAAKVQLGETYRELGEYQQALDTFSSILRDQETSLAVQRAAALTYQQRGETENYQWLERAIHGGYQLRSTGQNRIWGWLKIAQVAERAARSNAAFRDAFFEARLNVARCRYLAGVQQDGEARRQDIARAKQSIRSMVHLYPDLGGQRWRGEFDALLKEIQSAAGEQPVGLREFETPPS